MTLIGTQVNQILITLGYGSNLQRVTDAEISLIRSYLTQTDFPTQLVDRFTQIQTELATLETQRAEIMDLIYVSGTSRFQLNPGGALTLLNGRGSNLIQELSNLFDIPIRYNKYRGGSNAGSTTSYW